MKEFKHDYVLVLGNGFDLDFGLHTSYADFLKSNKWRDLIDEFIPQSRTNSLLSYLEKQKGINLWFNLEDALKEFAMCKEKATNPEADEREFEALRNALKCFIADDEDIRRDNGDEYSVSIRFLKALFGEIQKNPIYTFNYTPLEEIIKYKCCGLKSGPITYVHGNTKSDIVLGFELSDGETIVSGYDFMRKSVQIQKLGIKNHIADDILSAKEVIFFGHSLNNNDAPYFSEYFEVLLNDQTGRHATFFTKDSSSTIGMKECLGEEKTDMLLQRNKVKFVRTILCMENISDNIREKEKYSKEADLVDNLIDHIVKP